MVPIQYILQACDFDASLLSGCRWFQLSNASELDESELASLLARCHSAGAYLVLTDDIERCHSIAADGVLLSVEGIATVAAKVPQPTGIVLQRPRPITLAIGEARRTLGQESPQFVGVVAETAEDAVAAAKAGADFIQVPIDICTTLLQAVRERSFTTPVVALGAAEESQIPALLDADINGFAVSFEEIHPLMLPLLLNADEA